MYIMLLLLAANTATSSILFNDMIYERFKDFLVSFQERRQTFMVKLDVGTHWKAHIFVSVKTKTDNSLLYLYY